MKPHIIYIITGCYGRGENFRDWNATWAITADDANARIEQLKADAATFDAWRKQWLVNDPPPIPDQRNYTKYHARCHRASTAIIAYRKTMLDPWPYPEDGMFVDLPTYYAEDCADDLSHRHRYLYT